MHDFCQKSKVIYKWDDGYITVTSGRPAPEYKEILQQSEVNI